ncbi:sugar phosphate isomerase/epimerase family protein [Pelotalea chapellei]|nr:sugar phosphate isomerase/epimerase family protein [Pelotalea chapellei]
MNHPRENPLEEIRKFAHMGLDFIDLTLEPPGAGWWQCDPLAVRQALADHSLDIVGHTAYFLPLGHPFEEVRQGAVEAFRRSLMFFAKAGASWMNIHPDRNAPMHDRNYVIKQNLKSLGELLEAADGTGVGIMIENVPGGFNSADQLGELLDPLPQLGLHLDIGHTELMVEASTMKDILARFGDRLRHVHLHDNKGGVADLHLPLGAGTIDVASHLRKLKHTGYDGTITLEVFTPDPTYLAISMEKLRTMWDKV